MLAGVAVLAALVLPLESVSTHREPACTTLPGFTLQLGGLGPTAGQALDDPATRWALSRAWQQYLAVGCDWDVPEADIRLARSLGWRTVLTQSANPTNRANHAAFRNATPANLTTGVIRQLAVLNRTEDPCLLWEYMVEDDSSGTGFARQLISSSDCIAEPSPVGLSPARAQQLWESYLGDTDRAVQQALGAAARARPGGNVGSYNMARLGFPSSLHAAARSGADMVVLERTNDDVGSLAVGIAFARGAASQHGRAFGLDLSLWWGAINGCVSRLPASVFRRALHLGYASGAELLHVEGCGWVNRSADASRDGAGGGTRPSIQPLPIAQEVDRFGRMVAGALPPGQRGSPDVAAALILPHANGWSEDPSWGSEGVSWNYARLPNPQGRRGSRALLRLAFPGTGTFSYFAFPFGAYTVDDPPASPFARSSVRQPYAPRPSDVYAADPTVPFGVYHDRRAAGAAMYHAQRDPSAFRPMPDTRWGHVVDVLAALPLQGSGGSLPPASRLAGYPAVVLLERHNLTARDTALLIEYARGGGVVVCAVGTVGPEHQALTGLNLTGEVTAARAWSWLGDHVTVPSTAPWQAEPLMVAAVEPLPAASGNVTLLANSWPEQQPLVVRHRIGQGSVITCTVPWFETSLGAAPSGLLGRTFDEVIRPLQPIQVKGPPVAWTSSTRPDGGRVVTVANNAGGPWSGYTVVRVAAASGARSVRCLTLTTGKPCNAHLVGSDWRVNMTVPAFDVSVVLITPHGSPEPR